MKIDILTYEAYLNEIGVIPRESAIEAKRERDKIEKEKGGDSAEFEFHAGRVLAYYEVLSTIMTEAEAMEISLETLGLESFAPDKELL